MRNWGYYPYRGAIGRFIDGIVCLGGFVRVIWVSGGNRAFRDDASDVGGAHSFNCH
ncbi:MAG TPA: hypothetical protein VF070_07590 [Streptosporangiaceae bacterium]